MNITFDKQFLEKMSEGVVLLSRIGKITHFNRAARPWLNYCIVAEVRLGKIIKESFKTSSSPPVLVNLFEQGMVDVNPIEAYLCGGDTADYALFITGKTSSEASQKITHQNADFLALLSKDIPHEITQLREELSTISAESGFPAGRAIIQRADRLNHLVTTASQLSELNQLDASTQTDRISLLKLINEVVNDIPHLRAGFSINESLSDASDELGTLFGHKKWLQCGLRGLLENMGENAPPRSLVELRVRQNGGFIVLTANFIHATGLHKATPENLACTTNTALAMQADIRTLMAHRIFELHGGELKISSMDSDATDEYNTNITSFTLLLPTGKPAEGAIFPVCTDCPHYKQTELYANDLALSMLPLDHHAGTGI